MVAGGAGGGLYCFREQQTYQTILHLVAAAGGGGGGTETGPHILIELHWAARTAGFFAVETLHN